jgi:hypothetical protein
MPSFQDKLDMFSWHLNCPEFRIIKIRSPKRIVSSTLHCSCCVIKREVLLVKMSKKRPREVTAPDTRLIEIYDDLANEDEEIRLKAAHALLSQFSNKETTIELQKTILKRLFRGLCSGRKAARLGFSVALTEFLSLVFLSHTDKQKIKASEIIDLLESQTAADGSTSGQVRPFLMLSAFPRSNLIRMNVITALADSSVQKPS